jgi:hypothetical protein
MKGIGREVRTYAVRQRKSAAPSAPDVLALDHPAGVSIRLQSGMLETGERLRLADHLDALAKTLRGED